MVLPPERAEGRDNYRI